MVGYKLSKNDWVTPFFVIFRSVREKLLVTVSFDHPVALWQYPNSPVEKVWRGKDWTTSSLLWRQNLGDSANQHARRKEWLPSFAKVAQQDLHLPRHELEDHPTEPRLWKWWQLEEPLWESDRWKENCVEGKHTTTTTLGSTWPCCRDFCFKGHLRDWQLCYLRWFWWCCSASRGIVSTTTLRSCCCNSLTGVI